MSRWGALVGWFGTEKKDTIEALCERFQLPQRVSGAMQGLVLLFSEFEDRRKLRRSDAVFFLERIPIISLFCYDAMCDADEIHAFIRAYLSDWRKRRSVTDGTLLRSLGYESGAWMGALLNRLRAAWIDDEVSSPEAETALRDRFIREMRRARVLKARSSEVRRK